MAYLELSKLTKIFSKRRIPNSIDLSIEKGELHTLFGPSGCGKSTVLRLISGLLEVDEGKVILNGEDITRKSAEKRDITMVFQHFSLFPNMDVMGNITYGLKVKGIDRKKREEKGEELLNLVNLKGFGRRSVRDLSGGEKQRVAIARALAPDPKVLLMDEPLSALDAKLRESLRKEIRRIHKEVGTTIVFVTHDMEEAMELSDGISVMNEGNIIKTGSPMEIYESYGGPFIEKFLGRNNIINGKLIGGEDKNYLIRPERIILDKAGSFEGRVIDSIFIGDRIRLRVDLKGTIIEIITINQGKAYPKVDELVKFNIPQGQLKEES